jgi:hypothetical protein
MITRNPRSSSPAKVIGGFAVMFVVACILLLVANPVFHVPLHWVAVGMITLFAVVTATIATITGIAIVTEAVTARRHVAAWPPGSGPVLPPPRPQVRHDGWTPLNGQVIEAEVVPDERV